MSDLTDFFPAGGGGGGVSYDPISLERRIVNPSQFYLKTGLYINNNSTSSTFWNSYNLLWDSVAVTSSASYFTIKDVPSAPNGGRLHHVIGPCSASATQSTLFRITLDGTEYVIEGTGPLTTFQRFVLGGIPNLKPADFSSTGYASWFQPGNDNQSYMNAAEISTGGFIKPAQTNGFNMVPLDINLFNGINFKESLKIEVQGGTYSGSQYFNSAGAAVQIY